MESNRAADSAGNAYVTGRTSSYNLPTKNAMYGTHTEWIQIN
ncbi:MAG: hypothetical protein EX330_07260 [Candidatus Brocadia sp. BROELEC01]|nr:SBBP repeat-containing protein [Candidatus Brocadia sapporoensis]QQR68097.1 MAG: SBBP repeat-containing protein [Candidatus Brocadia sp.]RZV58149.1 MAG: hypothetical protein EX330_07260 [Candidatus Brocadia sp. BROELEC01]